MTQESPTAEPVSGVSALLEVFNDTAQTLGIRFPDLQCLLTDKTPLGNTEFQEVIAMIDTPEFRRVILTMRAHIGHILELQSKEKLSESPDDLPISLPDSIALPTVQNIAALLRGAQENAHYAARKKVMEAAIHARTTQVVYQGKNTENDIHYDPTSMLLAEWNGKQVVGRSIHEWYRVSEKFPSFKAEGELIIPVLDERHENHEMHRIALITGAQTQVIPGGSSHWNLSVIDANRVIAHSITRAGNQWYLIDSGDDRGTSEVKCSNGVQLRGTHMTYGIYSGETFFLYTNESSGSLNAREMVLLDSNTRLSVPTQIIEEEDDTWMKLSDALSLQVRHRGELHEGGFWPTHEKVYSWPKAVFKRLFEPNWGIQHTLPRDYALKWLLRIAGK